MDKEKEIEEMADILKQADRAWCRLADKTPSPYEYDAEKVIEAGYRKADEVRKETAKEILQDVKSTLAILMVHGEYCDDWNCGKVIDKVINPVETKFGVEVDE